jgi:GTP-binding protein
VQPVEPFSATDEKNTKPATVHAMKSIVAVIGRPNVGKSTLFNRITRSNRALVDDTPGVTRDRHYGDAQWADVSFTVVDTGGFLGADTDAFAQQIHDQLQHAIEDADVVVVLFDGKEGLSPFDRDLADRVRQLAKPVFYAVNKIDGIEQENRLYEFYTLGCDALYPVSAQHGYGVADFLDALVQSLPPPLYEEPQGTVKVSVVGRPNVGKSSLINRLLGQQRLIVSETAGTTRDAIDTMCRKGARNYRFVDTAGLRRKARVGGRLEKFSAIKALRSLSRCDVALIVLDAVEGIAGQDITIAGYALERGCACMFVLNKWDALPPARRDVKRFIDTLRREAKYVSFAPAVTVSAKTGLRVHRIFGMIDTLSDQYATRIATGRLNAITQEAVRRTEPSLHRGRRVRFLYTVQVSARPPTIVFFVNHPDGVHFSYRRYLVNQIREAAGLDQTPIRAFFRKRRGRQERSGH